MNRLHQLTHAKIIQRNFGTARSAKYMFNRNWSIEAALWHLLRTTTREKA